MNALLATARPYFAAAIWKWFDASMDDVLFSRWGFIKIRVRDIRFVIVMIAGEDPSVPPSA